MIDSKFSSSRFARVATVSACLLLSALLLSTEAEARPGFIGGGAHFNIGGHFGGMGRIGGFGGGAFRPLGPRPLPERRIEPDRRIIPDHRYPYRPHYWPGGYWAGAGAGVAAGAAIGSFVYALPPACTTLSVGGVTYERCDGSWYRPSYSGTQVVYEVVAPPG